MKKWFVMALAACMLTGLLAGCGSKEEGSAQVDLSAFDLETLILAIGVTIIALLTKFIGCGIGAWKLGPKSAAIVGVGMAPRGEVGIVVATLAFGTYGLITSSLFAVIIFMSMATTIIAPPILTWLFRRKIESENLEKVEGTTG